jgi:uncharacterized protein
MTSFRIEDIKFSTQAVQDWSSLDERNANWPVVYLLSSETAIYVGETLSASSRLEQHINSGEKLGLNEVHIILDETFNKSACLDLEQLDSVVCR